MKPNFIINLATVCCLFTACTLDGLETDNSAPAQSNAMTEDIPVLYSIDTTSTSKDLAIKIASSFRNY